MSNPDDYTDDRKKRLKLWKRNRDHTNGADAVKEAGTAYLPKLSYQTTSDYDAHKLSTEYFPGAARTLQSHTGLVFRKKPKLTAPTLFEDYSQAITADGKDLEQAAKWAFREYAITNDSGVLVDHPFMESGLSLADALKQDIRPFAALYSAENIYEISYGVFGGRKRLIRVLLKESDDRVRELELINGVYTVTIHEKSGSGWIVVSQSVPLQNGLPLSRIPFVPITDDEDGAAFDDISATNLTHYLHASKLNQALLWSSAPVPYVSGVDKDVELSIAPGSIWRFEAPEAKPGFLEFSGAGIGAIRDQLDDLKESMSILGSRMLASDKAASEAEGTIARRQASENSILASMARHVAARMQEVLRIIAEWMSIDPSTITFELNTDFVPTPLDPATLTQLVALKQAGELTNREFFDALQQGEIIGETVDFETRQAELEAVVIDPPIED